jgi:hypothetical protein
MRRRIRELITKRREPPTPVTYDAEWPASIKTIASRLHINYSTAYRLLRDEPGLIQTGFGKKKMTVRVPKEVFDRVIASRRT